MSSATTGAASAASASPDDVKRLAALARLSVPEEKLRALAAEFDSILKYIGQLDELKLDRAATPEAPALHNAFREDGTPHPSGEWTEALVKQFPARDGDSLSVKQIINYD